MTRAAYSAKELTAAYGIGMTTLYEEIKRGKLVARKLGTRTIFLAEDVAKWTQSFSIFNGGIYGGKDD